MFELFSEGGGNTYGLDFDEHGQVIAGTNWGGFAMLHQMQGAYYVKGFAKHGPLHNPHTYGYFEHVPYTGFKGGHVTCGGVELGHVTTGEMNRARVRPLQARYGSQQGGLASARWAEHDQEFVRVRLDRDALERLGAPEPFGDTLQA